MKVDYTTLSPRGPVSSAYHLPDHAPRRIFHYREASLAASAEPWTGVTTDGNAIPGLFQLDKTGVPTTPLWEVARDFVDNLPSNLRADALLDINSDEWRQWSNRHPFVLRHGVLLESVDEETRYRAINIIRETLSPDGYKQARDVMRLNETLREITGFDDEFGEWLYWLTAFGEPSPDEPWGWQIDGHHLNVNCLVVGDQMVATPTFMGSEPVHARTGKYAGTRVLQKEETRAVELMQSLDDARRAIAIIGQDLPRDVLTSAFRDNYELQYEGLRYTNMSADQRRLLVKLIEANTGRIRRGHAEIWMNEVEGHLDETYFAWIGGTEPDTVFYYRIHSPVLLIEFDHLPGVALEIDEPYRDHIHTVVRTPNGNDYGKDLLRQHYEQFQHENGRHVRTHRP